MSTKNIHKHPQLANQFQRCLRFGETSHHIGIGTGFCETTQQIPFHHSLACMLWGNSPTHFAELSHQIWASIWWVASPSSLVEGFWRVVSSNLGIYLVSCLTDIMGGMVQVSCLTKSGCLFGEMPHRLHWWKGVWWVLSTNLGVYLVSCPTTCM